MSQALPACILGPMHGRQRLRVILELEPAGPVRGTLVGDDGERQAFYGWLELAAALERLRLVEAGAAVGHEQATLLGDLSMARDARPL